MRATRIYGVGDIRVEDVADPVVQAPADAVVRVSDAAICGSDLWAYRGVAKRAPGQRIGHEFVGRVAEVGADVTTIRPGDFVVAPFAFGDGDCTFCAAGLYTSCPRGGVWAKPGWDGGQGEAVRVPFADANLVAVPDGSGEFDERLRRALLSLTDVMGTGHHAAVMANVRPGSTVAVVGDGAVGLCAVLAASRIGAERILLLGRNPARTAVAATFGATDIVEERGEAAVASVRELTGGLGPSAVLECVGTQDSIDTAIGAVRDGGSVSFVGIPHVVGRIDPQPMFDRNLGVRGGVAPVRAYLPELLTDVLAGTLDPSPVFDRLVRLDDIAEGYAAMDDRTAIKVHVKV